MLLGGALVPLPGVVQGMVSNSSENQFVICKVEVVIPILQTRKQIQCVCKVLTRCAKHPKTISSHHFHWHSCFTTYAVIICSLRG